ncbi:MAG: hypothetical protein ACFE8N_15170 [Promethearchaeota archaeon]
MQKQPSSQEKLKKDEILGSETVIEKLKQKTPWILGKNVRKPKINFPKFKLPRLSLPMPSKSISIVVIFVILFVLQTGIAYLLVRGPPALGANQQGDAVFIFGDIHEAYIIESIVGSILILLSSIGFIFLYQASKYVYNRKMAGYILVIGVLIIIISFISLQFIIYKKSGQFLQ